MKGNPNRHLFDMTKPMFLDSFLQEVTTELRIIVFMFKDVLLMNTVKEHLIKVSLVSSEVGPVCQAVCPSVPFFLIFLSIDASESKIYCDIRIFHHIFVQSANGQNKQKYAKEAVISLKLWVP